MPSSFVPNYQAPSVAEIHIHIFKMHIWPIALARIAGPLCKIRERRRGANHNARSDQRRAMTGRIRAMYNRKSLYIGMFRYDSPLCRRLNRVFGSSKRREVLSDTGIRFGPAVAFLTGAYSHPQRCDSQPWMRMRNGNENATVSGANQSH